MVKDYANPSHIFLVFKKLSEDMLKHSKKLKWSKRVKGQLTLCSTTPLHEGTITTAINLPTNSL